MKRYTGIYEQIYDFANLERAYKKARRCKRYRNEVLRYSRNLEENLINLQNHLIWHSYEQGIYRTFYVYEPKKRLISAGRVLASGRNASTAGGRAGRAASRKRGGTNRQ